MFDEADDVAGVALALLVAVPGKSNSLAALPDRKGVQGSLLLWRVRAQPVLCRESMKYRENINIDFRDHAQYSRVELSRWCRNICIKITEVPWKMLRRLIISMTACFFKVCLPMFVIMELSCHVFGGGEDGKFNTDHAYVPSDGWVVEFDLNMEEVRRFRVPTVETMTGACFNDAGNLVFIGRRVETARVIEIDATGQILREYDIGNGTLLRGSYIDFDPTRGLYVFADDKRLTYLDANLSLVAFTEALFTRASGVGFDPTGQTFATDQFQNTVYVFDEAFSLKSKIPFPSFVATGLHVSRNGSVLISLFGDGAIDRLDPKTGTRIRILGGLGYGDISDVLELPSGQLLTISYGRPLRFYAPDGQLLHASTVSTAGDSVAYLAPRSSFVRGDVNHDGVYDISDPIFILRHLFLTREEFSCQKSADIDDDGRVEISDATLLLSYIFKGFPAQLKNPFRICGFDPTIDELFCISYLFCQ